MDTKFIIVQSLHSKNCLLILLLINQGIIIRIPDFNKVIPRRNYYELIFYRQRIDKTRLRLHLGVALHTLIPDAQSPIQTADYHLH